MASLYPLKFTPILKEKIWGGNKIETILKHDIRPMNNCGESWEVSGIVDDESVVANGLIMNCVLGLFGGVLGGWLFDLLGVSWGGLLGQLGTAIVGAVVILWVASLIKK